VLEPERHATGLERRPHRAADVHRRSAPPPSLLVPQRGEASLQLGDRPVDGGQVLGGAGRERAIQLGKRPRRRELLGPLDQRPLQLATQVPLEPGDPLTIERRSLSVHRRLRLKPQRPPDPLHVHADHP